MSKLGTNTGASPNGLGSFLSETHIAGSPVPMLFSLDNNIAPTIAANSPTTRLVFRTQIYGPDNGNMYVGDPIAAGRARVDQCWPTLRQNPAQFYALDNEPGRSDVEGLTWLCNYNLGEMQRADELGIKLCVGEWSTGMPPISAAESASILEWIAKYPVSKDRVIRDDFTEAIIQERHHTLYEQHKAVIDERFPFKSFNDETDYISIYMPMLRYAMAHGHILGLHEYSLEGPMIGSPLCLRYRDLYAAVPADARPLLMISEAGPGAGYATGYTMQAYVDVVAAYDAELMRDRDVLGAGLFKLGKGESDMSEVMALLTDYVATHPTPPVVEPPPANEWDLIGHFNADTGALISDQLDYGFDLLSDISIDTRYQKKVILPETYTFQHKVTPPELAGRVTVTPAPGEYPRGQRVRITAS